LTTQSIIIGFALVTSLLYLLAISVTQAATAYALGEVYLGQPATIADSLRATAGKWYRYVGITFWQLGSWIWMPMVLVIPGTILLVIGSTGLKIVGGLLLFLGGIGGYIAGFIMYLRNLLAVPATVIERLPVRQSMRRSKVLSSGAKGRIFVVLLITGVLYLVIGAIQAPLLFMISAAARHGQESIGAHAGMLLINFVGRTLVSPIGMIGLCLVYFDQRVRKEALDLVMLMGGEVAAPVADWKPTAEPAQVWPPINTVVAESAPPAQIVERSPEEDAGHANDSPLG